MTDSPAGQTTAGERPAGKRARLVGAAAQLLHEQGIERTTLAEIARLADVPPGNVYYYFKTKDDVVAAVVQAHEARVRAMLAAIDSRHRSPKSRLKAFVAELTSRGDVVARYGCPLGSLCSEIDKRDAASEFAVASLLRVPIEWAETQFRSLGRADAHDLAIDLLATYEGSALLANTMRDPNLLTEAGRRVDRRIDAL
jgi:AcrR family transcriptional regulator